MKNKISIFMMAGLFAIGVVTISAFAAGHELAAKDKEFMKNAASGGMMEVELGHIAQSKATSKEVQNFANRMVNDHSKINDELKALASQKNVPLPTTPEQRHKAILTSKLDKTTGADFDKKYMRLMLKGHKHTLEEFREAAKESKDADLKAWAEKTLPVIKEHLHLAKEIAGNMGVSMKKK